MSNRKLQVSYLFLVLVALFCVCLVASNLFATKPFTFGHLSFTGAILIFPLSYIINDVVAEVWGFRKARAIIWLAFGLNFFFVIAGFIVDIIPGAPWWEETASSGFHAVFGLAPRVAGASFLAFIVGSYVNAMVISKMKVRQKGRFFVVRAVVSSLFGELCDSMIFFPIALAGVVIPWSQMPTFVLWQVLLKTAYEIVILPITVRVVRWVKKYEGVDVYDVNIKYTLWPERLKSQNN